MLWERVGNKGGGHRAKAHSRARVEGGATDAEGLQSV